MEKPSLPNIWPSVNGHVMPWIEFIMGLTMKQIEDAASRAKEHQGTLVEPFLVPCQACVGVAILLLRRLLRRSCDVLQMLG
jgi:hypothetical protein